MQIFIRTNSGGTVLSYSDLLLSVAVTQWSKYDAREEIHQLVNDLNRNRPFTRRSDDRSSCMDETLRMRVPRAIQGMLTPLDDLVSATVMDRRRR